MSSHVDVAASHSRIFSRESLLYFALITGLLLGVLLVERLFPVGYVYLISEDKIGEYSTSVAFAAAGGLFIASGMRSIGIDRTFLFFMAFLSLLVAGEEISWGQRIFGIDTPEIMRSVNRQGEITLHNIGALQKASFHEAAGIFLQVLMLTAASKNRLPQRLRWLGKLSLPSLSLWPATVVVSYLLLAMPLVKGDEIAEAFLSFIILFWSFFIAVELNAVGHAGRSREFAVVAVLAATVAAGTFLSASFGKNMGWRYNITASRDYPNAGMMQQSRILFEHIISDPDLIQPDTLKNFRQLHQ